MSHVKQITRMLLSLTLPCILLGKDYGPPIGAKLPAFELLDQAGKKQSLQTILGPKGAVILFYQSADWCPFCKAQLVELEQNRGAFEKLGLGIAAISYDSVAILRNFAERRSIHFSLLSDPDSKLIRDLGLLNLTVTKDSPFFGVPYPGFFVLDGSGLVTAKYFEDDVRERYTSAGILMRQFGIETAALRTEVQGRQLSGAATASNSIIAAGQRVTLRLDLQLKPGVHVYAPGVEGYIQIEWKMKDSDAFRAAPVDYPPSEKLHLAAIDETVPVYRDQFRLTRDLTFAQDSTLRSLLDSSGKLSVEGTLRYQACDDRICYIPQELPLKWIFQYAEFDHQRVPQEMRRKVEHPCCANGGR